MNANPRFEYLLRFGDNALVLAQQLSAWVAHSPVMEEDVAFANVALDLFGQARLWLSYAAEVEGEGRGEDALAFHRDAAEFRNALIVERPNGDFAQTIARSFFYDAWSHLALRELFSSKDERIAAIAAKSEKECAYHLRRSRDWFVRLGDGTDESRQRLQRAVDELWRYTGELFIGDEIDARMHREGVGFEPASLEAPWLDFVRAAFDEATLTLPPAGYMQRGGKQGLHTEALSYLLAEMQVLPRAYPEAVW